MVRARKPAEVEEIDLDPQETPAPQAVEAPPALPRFLDDGFPNPKAMDIWEYMAALTPEQWQGHLGYLYRTNPTLARTQGQAANLMKFTGPITEEDVREQYGGYGFLIILKREGDRVYSHRFAIEAPPKLQAGETVQGKAEPVPSASSEAAALQGYELLVKLVDDVLKQRDAAAAQGRAFNPQDAVKNAMEFQGKGYEAALDLVVAQTKKIVAGESSAPGNKLMETMMQAMVDRLLNPPDPMKQLEATLTLVDKLRGEGGGHDEGGGSRRQSWKETLAEKAIEQLPALLGRVENSLRFYAEGQAARAAAAGVTFRRPAVAMNPAPSAVAAPPPTVGVGGAAPTTVQPLPDATQITPQQYSLVLQDNVKKTVVAMLFAWNPADPDSDDGEDAAFVAEKIYPEYAAYLAKVMKERSPELAQDEVLRSALRNPNLEKFAADFVRYFEEGEETVPAPIPTG